MVVAQLLLEHRNRSGFVALPAVFERHCRLDIKPSTGRILDIPSIELGKLSAIGPVILRLSFAQQRKHDGQMWQHNAFHGTFPAGWKALTQVLVLHSRRSPATGKRLLATLFLLVLCRYALTLAY